jgi:hypothetical protein
MQYLLMIYESEKAWADLSESARNQMFGEYAKLTADIKAAGKYCAGNALQPTSTATTVRVRDGKMQVTDGPFVESREQLGGYYLIEATDLDDATKIAARIPAARHGSIEVRPVMVLNR